MAIDVPDRALVNLAETLDDLVGWVFVIAVATVIEANYGKRVTEVAQTIRAVALGATLAEKPQAPVGSLGLKVTRCYLNQVNEAVEIAVATHPADRMLIESRLRRDGA